MRNLLALFGLLVIGFVGVGWYMGWYKLSVTKSSDGHLEIKTDVDTKKVGADSSDALNKLGTVISNQAEKAAQDAKTALPPVPAVTPGPLPQAPGITPSTPITIPVAPEMPTAAPALPAGPQVPPKGPIQLVPPK
jgi:hypothetical protein